MAVFVTYGANYNNTFSLLPGQELFLKIRVSGFQYFLTVFSEILVKSSLPFSGKDIIPQIGTRSSGFFDVYKNFPKRFLCVNFAREPSA